ncbi:MAG: hypothetical protein DRI69_05645 [Bacteroidetes bacterium]|nr:MAG: hypothetical protein DRI69_05645 [Bacteroidota bacterium]
MKLRNIYLVLISLLFISWNSAGPKYPTDYFELPLNRSVLLSGTFGELRPGHFHSGIDIKSLKGTSGEIVSASAQGFIARIKVAPGGYGNAIYIAHPNGYTTVYAHLDHFDETVAAYVKEKQYELKKFSVDLYPKPTQFQLNKGQLIGYMGNSGSSSAPHLHFEIRRTSGQVPINPFLFGLQVTDKVRPDIGKLQVYYLSEDLKQIDVREYPLLRTASGRYTIADTLSEGAWRVGFALKTTDKMDGAPNRNGIYELQMQVDDDPRFSFALNEVPFSKTRYLNAHIDYAARQKKKGYYHRCFKLPGNALDIYSRYKNNGVVKLYSNQSQKVSIEVNDINGNISTVTFFIKRDADMSASQIPAAEFSADNEGSLSITKSNFKCTIGTGALYAQTGIDYRTEKSGQNHYSALHHIGSENIPLHKYISISIKPEDLPSALRDKAFVGRLDEEVITNYGGKYSNGYFTASVREFGNYTIEVDTTSPMIKPIQFSSKMQGASRMRFSITDNMPIGGKARGLRYNAHVDGKWILMEYDAKKDMLTHRFDERISTGDHEIVLKVRDDRGNVAEFRRTFTR